MDNTKEENISNIEFKEGEFPSEYKLLVEKLKKIKVIINALEKKFLEKEI